MTAESVEIVHADDGRWHWHWHTPGPDAALPRLSFKTRAEAVEDAALHAAAARDATGRRVMGKDYLRRLISAAALTCEACADVYFGGVYWHRRSADGANWGVAIMNGAGDHDGCLACVHSTRETLRRHYSIADEG